MTPRGFLTLALLALAPFASQAGIVSGIQTTSAGKSVDLQGLEWLSIDSTRGLSRAEVSDGALGYTHEGWRYATRQETSKLLHSLWGGTYLGGSADNGDGATWFFLNLGHGDIQFGAAVLRNFFYGSEGECTIDPGLSCHGSYGVAFSNVGAPTTGWFYSEFGLNPTDPNPAVVEVGERSNLFGHLLVREGELPEPGSLPLTALAILAAWRIASVRGRGAQTVSADRSMTEWPQTL